MSDAQYTPRFYVYVLVRPDGRPFYVGKGSGYRTNAHLREAQSGHRCPKCSVIRKILRASKQVQIDIVFRTDDESAAFAHEIALIASIGIENLTNLTPGGEGPVLSAKSRAILSAKAKKRYKNYEAIKKLSLAQMGHPVSAETRAKMSAGVRAHNARRKGGA